MTDHEQLLREADDLVNTGEEILSAKASELWAEHRRLSALVPRYRAALARLDATHRRVVALFPELATDQPNDDDQAAQTGSNTGESK